MKSQILCDAIFQVVFLCLVHDEVRLFVRLPQLQVILLRIAALGLDRAMGQRVFLGPNQILLHTSAQ